MTLITPPDNLSSADLLLADASLELAFDRWKPYMLQAEALLRAGHLESALAPASEAIRRSADVHPQYHFLESGLHTALGGLHLCHGEYDEAKRHFERAVFLHHDNPVALAGLQKMGDQAGNTPSPPRGEGRGEGAEGTNHTPLAFPLIRPAGPPSPHGGEGLTLPPYTHAKAWAEWLEFCGVEDTGQKSDIFTAWLQAKRADKDEAISFYSRAITLCDATHQQYHALAAQPWWLRAALHRALGEHLLAMNDLKRGLDLDRQNAWARQQLAELKEVP